MAAPPVTPRGGITYSIAVGGTAVIVVPPAANGGYIINPFNASDQGIGTAENLTVDPVSTTPGSGPGSGNNTAETLFPGNKFYLIPGSTLPVAVNAETTGHKFTVVWW